MTDASGKPVAPSWSTSCGDPSKLPYDASGNIPDGSTLDGGSRNGGIPDPQEPTLAISLIQYPMHGCTAFPPLGTLGSISVASASVLGGLACGAGAGQVDHLVVTPSSGGSAQSISCGAVATFSGYTSMAPIELSVTAFSAGASAAAWSTSCSVTPTLGAVTVARCAPLSASGALLIQPSMLHGCTTNYQARLLGAGEVSPWLSCSSPARFDGLAPGSYMATVELAATSADAGATLSPQLCSGIVSPGTITTASCQ